MAAEIEEKGIRDALALTATDTASSVSPAGSLFRITCTVAGNVKVVLESGNTEVIAVTAGYFCYPYRVVRVSTTDTTATATYANLYV